MKEVKVGLEVQQGNKSQNCVKYQLALWIEEGKSPLKLTFVGCNTSSRCPYKIEFLKTKYK